MKYVPCLDKSVSLIAVVLAMVIAHTRAEAKTEPDPLPLTQLQFIFDIVVDRADPGRLLLATRAGIYRVAPDGTARRISKSENAFWNLAAHPTERETMLARGIPDDGEVPAVVISRDSGRSWRRVAGSPTGWDVFRKIDMSKSLPDIVYGITDRLWASRNGGMTWLQIGPLPERAIDIAASSLHAETVYIATLSGVMASDDGGGSWREIFTDAQLGPVTVIEAGWNGVLYAFGLHGGLLKAGERTGKWAIVNDDFGGCIVQHLATDPTNTDRLYAVLRCNAVIASIDGGRTWTTYGAKEQALPECLVHPYRRSEPDPWDSELEAEGIAYTAQEALLNLP